jgi:predicted Co/Zn/Cd cation transporter (cation efflux family)
MNAILVTALCAAVTWYLRKQSRITNSPIVAVDAKNWWIDTLITAGVAVAFFIALIIEQTPWPWLASYVDPIVVIAIVVVMLPVPWKIIRENWGQLVSRAVEPECIARIESQLAKVRAEMPWADQRLRVVRMGRVLYVHLYILEGPERIPTADRCREKILDVLQGLDEDLALDISFTEDPVWMRLASGDE